MPKHKSSNESGPSQRVLRMGELVRHALAEMLARGEIHDPVIEKHTITIPEVAMTPDLRHATAYVVPLGGKDEKPVIDALNRHKKFMRGQLAKKIEAKFMPELHFRLDERFGRAEKIDELLRRPEVARDLKREDK